MSPSVQAGNISAVTEFSEILLPSLQFMGVAAQRTQAQGATLFLSSVGSREDEAIAFQSSL